MAESKIRRVLIIGSGAVKIAEAAEFDYSGSQALKAFREEGIKTILVNPNVATVQTSHVMADRVYMVPITVESVSRIIEAEKPDAIAAGFGGQTALSVGLELKESGFLETHHVEFLGTPSEGIRRALSRELFRKRMVECGIPIPSSASAKNEHDAVARAQELEYPLMMRVSFNLGGRGSSVLWNERDLKTEAKRAFSNSPESEILLESYLHHWKEIEYEVVRDRLGNVAVTACIENLDPMGVHTGDSVVVTPSQTLDNYEYNAMRSMAIRVAESINLVGECNVQFALNPKGSDFYVIETNPRMSRSSALASKATGYPLAYVSAKLALGYLLYEIKNSITKATTAFFEPSLDYVTVKMPRWDISKFEGAENSISSEMKSIGEVMSIGRNFEEAMQKGIRMLGIGEPGLVGGRIYNSQITVSELERILAKRPPYWQLYAAKAFKVGMNISEVHEITGVDVFFLNKLKGVVDFYEQNKGAWDDESLKEARRLGFSSELVPKTGSRGFVKRIDTVAGEFSAVTNYLFTTSDARCDDKAATGSNGYLIMGAGGFRIGVSVEFDWAAVSLARALSRRGKRISIINCNPETVSTDWDICDKLYFEELSAARILEINSREAFEGIAVFTAGQQGNNIAKRVSKSIPLFGASGKSIDMAEDRAKFSAMLSKLSIPQPRWTSAESTEEVEAFANQVGFPILVRPSYVLSGTAMNVASDMGSLKAHVTEAAVVSEEHPVVLSKFIPDAIEAEMDCVSDGDSVTGTFLEHVEDAGVHSGDATLVIPTIKLSPHAKVAMRDVALKLARELRIRGPFNIQFIVKDDTPYVIELNLRASRSMPLSSKATSTDLMELSATAILGKLGFDGFRELKASRFMVKSPQFSWSQMRGAYPCLGPDMRSTGEVASIGECFDDALLNSWLSVTPNKRPLKAALIYGKSGKNRLAEAAAVMEPQNAFTITDAAISGLRELRMVDAMAKVRSGEISIIMTHGSNPEFDRDLRRLAVDLNVPLVLDAGLSSVLAKTLRRPNPRCIELSEPVDRMQS